MGNNFTAFELVSLLKIKEKDFFEMGIPRQDAIDGKISSRKLKKSYMDKSDDTIYD